MSLPFVSSTASLLAAPSLRDRVAMALAGALCVLLLTAAVPAGTQRTPGLDETRERVQALTQNLSDAETELSGLESAAEEAGVRFSALDDESAALSDIVVVSAISEFMRAEDGPSVLVADDLNAARRAETLTDAAIGADTEAMERYRSLFEDLAVARAELADKQTASAAQIEELLATREELGVELARLEELEQERLVAEERRRLAAQAAAAKAAAAQAAASSQSTSGGSAGSGVADGGVAGGGVAGGGVAGGGVAGGGVAGGGVAGGGVAGGGVAGGGGATSVAVTGTGTLKTCPVAGANSFIDSWGFARSGGRRHKGVDMMASIGTPIAAPVSGTVEHRSNRVGGRSFHLNGDDGNYYYGTHMSGYEASGRVNAGDIIGYVGDDGNARGIPHLHFEVHLGGGGAVNPYPYVAAVC